MAGPLAQALYWVLVVATAVAHFLILRSTLRGMRAAPSRGHGAWEWVWAFLPLAGLVVLFVWTWQVMHPETLNVTLPATRVPPGGIGT